jgi:hypothetical protein
MQGWPLPRIVQRRINRDPGKERRFLVRETLELVESDVRYQCVRLFGCYTSILTQVLEDLNMQDVLANLPAVPLFLEIGASDRTMISLMAIGLSRPTALRLAASTIQHDLDVPAAVAWLRSIDLDATALSPFLRAEVAEIISDLSNVVPLR